VQAAFGITNYAWDGDSICFSNEQTLVRFYQGRRKTDVNGTTVWLNAPPEGSVTGGDWRLSVTDLDLLQLSILPKEEGPVKPVLVMLDPGHGGEDDGANRADPPIKEKDLTLALALKIGECLTNAGLQVTFTRTNDTALALDKRSALARKSKADLFVSIHANFAANPDAAGAETYVLTPSGFQGTAEGSRIRGWQIGNRNDYHNTLLGFSIHSQISALGQGPDRGLKRQSFSVLRETSCPAVLLEFGFLSNREEALRMLDRSWQDNRAAAVTAGILSYVKKVDALDRAVADKRARDAESNERWRQHLAAQASQPAAAASNTVCSLNGATSSITNSAAAALEPLVEFYATGQAE
jgi:N-acetylmuramoyl-L-alanine amidase